MSPEGNLGPPSSNLPLPLTNGHFIFKVHLKSSVNANLKPFLCISTEGENQCLWWSRHPEEEDRRAQGWWWRVEKVRQVWRDEPAGGLKRAEFKIDTTSNCDAAAGCIFILNEMKDDRTLMGDVKTTCSMHVPWRFLSEAEWGHNEQPHTLFSVRRRPLSCSSEHKWSSCWCYRFPRRTFSLRAIASRESAVNNRITHICLVDVLWECWCFCFSSGPGCPTLRLESQHSPPRHYREKHYDITKAGDELMLQGFWLHIIELLWFGIEPTALFARPCVWELVLCAYILISVGEPLWGGKQCPCR